LNRKEGIVVVAVLLSTFIGGVFAAQNVPAMQQVFVTNFPKNQNVTVTNPTTTSITVQNLALQKTILVVDRQNITLPGCILPVCPGIPLFLATSPVNSSLGFREAFVYIHVDSVSPGTSGGIAYLIVNQKPSASFPGDSTSTLLLIAGNGAVANLTASVQSPVTGEQFVFYLQPQISTPQTFTNITLSVFLEN